MKVLSLRRSNRSRIKAYRSKAPKEEVEEERAPSAEARKVTWIPGLARPRGRMLELRVLGDIPAVTEEKEEKELCSQNDI